MAKTRAAQATAPSTPASSAGALTPALHERVVAEAGRLPEGSFGKAPLSGHAIVEHHRTLARTARRDADALVAVPLVDGALTADEIAFFAPLVEAAAQQGDLVRADLLRGPRGPTKEDAAFLKGVRADQKLLLNAFRRLRFKGQSAELARLQEISRGEDDDARDARNDATALIALADHDDHRAWVATLPMGEAGAVARMKTALPRLAGLASAAREDAAADGRKVLLRRIWALVKRSEQRIRAAGAYRYNGRPTRKDYDAYRSSRPKKRVKAAKPTEKG